VPTAAGQRLTQAHRIAQRRLGAQTIARLLQVWSLLDPDDLDATITAWLLAAEPIVRNSHLASVALASDYARTHRAAETGTIEPPPPVANPVLELGALRTSLTVTGPVSVKQAMLRGVPLAKAMDTAKAAHSAAGMRHALSGGREYLVTFSDIDPDVYGFRRVTSGGSCKYCSDLAQVVFDTGRAFEAHDGCSCTVAPVYSSPT
jgi:hypothetical protein